MYTNERGGWGNNEDLRRAVKRAGFYKNPLESRLFFSQRGLGVFA